MRDLVLSCSGGRERAIRGVHGCVSKDRPVFVYQANLRITRQQLAQLGLDMPADRTVVIEVLHDRYIASGGACRGRGEGIGEYGGQRGRRDKTDTLRDNQGRNEHEQQRRQEQAAGMDAWSHKVSHSKFAAYYGCGLGARGMAAFQSSWAPNRTRKSGFE